MSRALQSRVERLERRRTAIEQERAEAQMRFEVDSILAECRFTLNGERLSLWQLRELFGPDFLADPRRWVRRQR